MRAIPAIVTLVIAGSVAPARAEDPAAKWTKAVDGVVAASAVVQGWTHIGTPEALDKAWITWRVKLRHFVDAGQKWLASVAANAKDTLEVPDVSLLTIEPIHGVESSGYGWRVDPINNNKKFHKGTDYKADRGTPVHAAGDAIVAFTGRQKGYGKVIYLDHGGGLITRYAHLSAIDVETGDAVAADTVIGKVGSTGRTTGPHLHFEIRVSGRAIDPVQGMLVAKLQREQPGIAWLAAMSLLPEVQRRAVDAHDPPPGMRKQSRKNRPNT